MKKIWLDWGREINALAQNGLTFTKDPFDRERYEALQEIAREIISSHSAHSSSALEKVFSAEGGYSTPKVDVRGATFRDGKVLLVKESSSERWTLPGGFVDVNETISEATAREVREESGVSVKPIKLAAVYDHRQHGYKPHLYHFFKVYMICEHLGGELRTNMETSATAYFERSALEALPLDPARVTLQHILRMFDHYADPQLPADFD